MISVTYKKIYIILIILAVLILAVLACMLILNISKQDEETELNNIDQIEKNNDNRILEYNLFYTLESITQQVIEGIRQGIYDGVYELFENADKTEIYNLFEEYKQAMNALNSEIKYLTNAHRIEENIYSCEFEIQGYRQSMIIKLNTKNNTYKILELDKWGYVND